MPAVAGLTPGWSGKLLGNCTLDQGPYLFNGWPNEILAAVNCSTKTWLLKLYYNQHSPARTLNEEFPVLIRVKLHPSTIQPGKNTRHFQY